MALVVGDNWVETFGEFWGVDRIGSPTNRKSPLLLLLNLSLGSHYKLISLFRLQAWIQRNRGESKEEEGEQATHATLAKPGLGRSRRPIPFRPKPSSLCGLFTAFVVVADEHEWWPTRLANWSVGEMVAKSDRLS
jgi:hypothetical protein